MSQGLGGTSKGPQNFQQTFWPPSIWWIKYFLQLDDDDFVSGFNLVVALLVFHRASIMFDVKARIEFGQFLVY